MANDRARLTERVREIMAETFDVSVDELPDDVRSENFAPWNSLAQLTLLVALEEDFGVSFSITDMNKMGSLPQIVDVLMQNGVAVGP